MVRRDDSQTVLGNYGRSVPSPAVSRSRLVTSFPPDDVSNLVFDLSSRSSNGGAGVLAVEDIDCPRIRVSRYEQEQQSIVLPFLCDGVLLQSYRSDQCSRATWSWVRVREVLTPVTVSVMLLKSRSMLSAPSVRRKTCAYNPFVNSPGDRSGKLKGTSGVRLKCVGDKIVAPVSVVVPR
jgi:hypothetical protein